jgi:phytoene desaturase
MGTGKSVIIVGAGIGGIVTAIKLAKNGFRVSVYEKNSSPGGRCGQISKAGHRFDLGATILLMPSIYKMVFEYIDLKFEESIELKQLTNVYRIYFNDGNTFSFSGDQELMKSQLEKIEPGSYPMFKKYISTGYRFFKISMEKLLGKNFFYMFQFIKPANLSLLIDLKTYITHSSFIRRFFKHPDLRRAFTFQNIYVGQSPSNAPALFSMLPAVELTEGARFPVGGMYQVVEKLFMVAKELGVDFHFNSTVEKIQTSKNHVMDLKLQDGTLKSADIFVINADLPYACSDLLPDRRLASRMEKLRYACSAIVFHWGVDKIFQQLDHHNVILSDDYNNNLDMIFRKKTISDHPSFYIHSPARTDPSAAPPGQDSFTVIVPCGHVDNTMDQDWEKMKGIARTSIFNQLHKIGIKDLEKHIKFEICYTPLTWKGMLNIYRGAVFGSLSHSIFQMGYFRPHNRHDNYRNLYFVGGSTHPGNGVPLVLLSAKLTSERILTESRKN